MKSKKIQLQWRSTIGRAIEDQFPCRFDPLGLGADPERLAWFAESERVHARWAMLAVAGILVQVCASPPHSHRILSHLE